jgi:hypothetical protein
MKVTKGKNTMVCTIKEVVYNVTDLRRSITAHLGVAIGRAITALPNWETRVRVTGANKGPLFLISSTLRPSQAPLSYSSVRSRFSPTERLQQTVASIESIRTRVDGARIWLLENSPTEANDVSALTEAGMDVFVDFSHDPVAVRLRDCPHKGAAEVYMIRWALKSLQYDGFAGPIFKLSGRYRLSDAFSINRFPADRYGFQHHEGGVVSTVLYSVPASRIGEMAHVLTGVLVAAVGGMSIEAILPRCIPPAHIGNVSRLGVYGLGSVGGEVHEQ